MANKVKNNKGRKTATGALHMQRFPDPSVEREIKKLARLFRQESANMFAIGDQIAEVLPGRRQDQTATQFRSMPPQQLRVAPEAADYARGGATKFLEGESTQLEQQQRLAGQLHAPPLLPGITQLAKPLGKLSI